MVYADGTAAQLNDVETQGNVSRVDLLREKIRTLVDNLSREADRRVGQRNLIEQRWLTDLAQFHGKYEDKILKELIKADKSQVFINETRPKTNACEARLTDMLFPTDDRNFGINPTPVPELTLEAEESARKAAELKRKAAETTDGSPLRETANQAVEQSELIQTRLDEARKRARAMEEEIDDTLRQCSYAIQAREVIRDACKLGTGIMKGPVIGGRSRRSWELVSGNVYQLKQQKDPRPKYWRVDPWNFFPDMDTTSIEDSEGNYERHLMNSKRLRKLSKEPGFDPDAIRRLLRESPRMSTPSYIADLRSITGAYHDTGTDKYHVWEYHGQLCASDLHDLAMLLKGSEEAEAIMGDIGVDGEIDPLLDIEVNIWFCQGEVLKFGIHHLDSGDPIYSVFCLEKDEACIFGFGIPYLMRDNQKALCAAWRIMLDNAALSSGPQIVVNSEVLEPVNGSWQLQARKIWKRKTGAAPGAMAFESYDIPMHQAELANIVEMAKRNIDEETNISVLAQGEQGAHVTQTAHGMNLLMNATNVVFRRIVKNWDDDMTTPNIRRLYDFFMQFSPKDYIKGDFDVDARGTSVLLVREMQSANLLAFLIHFGAHPILSKYLKDEGLPALRRLAQTMMIPADEMIKTDEEIARDAAKAADSPPMPDLEIMKLEAQMNQVERDGQLKLELAQMQRETELMKLAAQHNMKLEELRAMLEESRSERDSKERIMAAEAAVTLRQGASGGGYL